MRVTLLFVAALAIAGCSGSSSPASTSSGGGATNVCPKITQADIQALLVAAIATIDEHDESSAAFECDVGGLQIEMETDDADESFYMIGYGDGTGDTHPLDGFGDEAFWLATDSGTGVSYSTPTVAVHKGSATCNLSTDDIFSKYTMPYSAEAGTIANADADAWSRKAAKVCVEFFTAVGQ